MRRLLVAITAAVSLLAAGCGGSDSDALATESASGPIGSETLGDGVLTGEATTVSGESFDLGSLADKDLVVWFWAPW